MLQCRPERVVHRPRRGRSPQQRINVARTRRESENRRHSPSRATGSVAPAAITSRTSLRVHTPLDGPAVPRRGDFPVAVRQWVRAHHNTQHQTESGQVGTWTATFCDSGESAGGTRRIAQKEERLARVCALFLHGLVGEDLDLKSAPRSAPLQTQAGETVLFAWITFNRAPIAIASTRRS